MADPASTPENIGVFNKATDTFIKVFSDYEGHFFSWGNKIFVSLLIINVVLLSLQYAFNEDSIKESMANFIKQSFIILFFYTLMLNIPWLFTLIHSPEAMGNALVKDGILTPSAVLTKGFAMGLKIFKTAGKAGLLSLDAGFFVALITYIVFIFVFISIALDLAVTIIVTSWLGSIAALFCCFAALEATRNIARHYLDALLGNCVKLLGLYLVISVGQGVIDKMDKQIPPSFINPDAYGWLLASALLFWLVSKNFPPLIARILSNAINESRGASAAALAFGAYKLAKTGSGGGGKASAGSTAGSMASKLGMLALSATTGVPMVMKAASAAVKAASAIKNAVSSGSSQGGSVSGQFKNLSSKMGGGSSGNAGSSVGTPGGKNTATGKGSSNTSNTNPAGATNIGSSASKTDAKSAPGNPSSAGRKSAAPSSTRAEGGKGSTHTSKPKPGK